MAHMDTCGPHFSKLVDEERAAREAQDKQVEDRRIERERVSEIMSCPVYQQGVRFVKLSIREGLNFRETFRSSADPDKNTNGFKLMIQLEVALLHAAHAVDADKQYYDAVLNQLKEVRKLLEMTSELEARRIEYVAGANTKRLSC